MNEMETCRTYEVDELFTYYGNKTNRICVIYALERETKSIVRIRVGRRNKGKPTNPRLQYLTGA